jgi:hypothetical protein
MFPTGDQAVTIKLPICKGLSRLWSQAQIVYVAPWPGPLNLCNMQEGCHDQTAHMVPTRVNEDGAAQVPSSASCEPQASAQTRVLATLHGHSPHITPGVCPPKHCMSHRVPLAWQWPHAGRKYACCAVTWSVAMPQLLANFKFQVSYPAAAGLCCHRPQGMACGCYCCCCCCCAAAVHCCHSA